MNTGRHFITARRLGVTAMVGGVFVFAAGCGARNGLVGKWQTTKSLPTGQSVSSTIEFTPDGKETITNSSGQQAIVINGTYVAKDDNIQMTITGMTMNGMTYPVTAQKSTAQSVPFKVDGDTLTVTMPGQGQPVTLTRVKS